MAPRGSLLTTTVGRLIHASALSAMRSGRNLSRNWVWAIAMVMGERHGGRWRGRGARRPWLGAWVADELAEAKGGRQPVFARLANRRSEDKYLNRPGGLRWSPNPQRPPELIARRRPSEPMGSPAPVRIGAAATDTRGRRSPHDRRSLTTAGAHWYRRNFGSHAIAADQINRRNAWGRRGPWGRRNTWRRRRTRGLRGPPRLWRAGGQCELSPA